MYTKRIQDCIEAICAKGCQAVRDDMVQLERGQRPPEAAELDVDELRMVVRELKSIMAVYGDTCRPRKRRTRG